ncbi:MAG: AMP-binding protein [Candidatus Sedimenticola endophacoides]
MTHGPQTLGEIAPAPQDLATIVYTSGTTGRPKGVMLNHHNILCNAAAGLEMITVYPRDRTLSFLPLSHMLERTAGYYLMLLAGASVAFARSIPLLGEDLRDIRPSILISVPRIFERVYGRIMEQVESAPAPRRWLFEQATRIGWKSFEHHQGRRPWSPDLLFQPLLDALVGGRVRARLGGRLRFAISGGAALSASIARTFIALGVPIQQGYGLTEFAPIISVNRLEDNLPASVGTPLPEVEVRVDEHQELLVRGCSLMQGYWNDPGGTAQALDPQGWLHTGDQVLRKRPIINTCLSPRA